MIAKKSQTSIEYAFLITIFILACLAMLPVFKNSLQGRYKKEIDSYSDEQFSFNGTQEDFREVIYTQDVYPTNTVVVDRENDSRLRQSLISGDYAECDEGEYEYYPEE